MEFWPEHKSMQVKLRDKESGKIKLALICLDKDGPVRVVAAREDVVYGTAGKLGVTLRVCNVRRSGSSISALSSTTVAAPSHSVASTPALPIDISAFRHCKRIFLSVVPPAGHKCNL